ncbi:Rne/Rng family ribonuclease [Amycolatopsis acidiphila]|uniref:Ribonuclease E n=1 Tax=Amycolatopsis acidiphila TaxID=715473 RepID=A0A558A3N2_9PSEU|nr:Rne/Rng family ribonuclease [Amycolatopsis acidiphila]TVT18847.1 Rne/Rng family ribonuclease [Amycolatopsis acidiphila]UIJ61768.1 Rne/Rng family ribonuclease [Amycolatopsis acidiphila]GHG57980.1 ribonuclease E [Amycolatopsis acidiphila]
MTNAETPAENTGGDTAAPTGPLGELPARVRVHALAKLLGSNSRDVLAKLTELGETARSAQSSVPKDVAIRVAEALAGPAEEPTAAEVAAVAQAEPEAPESDTTEITAAPDVEEAAPERQPAGRRSMAHVPVFAAPSPVFLPPEPPAARPEPTQQQQDEPVAQEEPAEAPERDRDDDGDDANGRRRRRRGRRGRGRGKGGDEGSSNEDESTDQPEHADEDKPAPAQDERKPDADAESDDEDSDDTDAGSRRRRRRRRRKASEDDNAEPTTGDDPPNTVVHVREAKGEDKSNGREAKADKADKGDKGDGVRSVRGSTRLEAKRQRRRDGREAGRRRAPILSEAEFLARREAVERTMVVAERGDHTQIGVLEDGVLVEHFVTSSGSGSIVGNVYLGRVQNVLPSMEAAFVDIGRGRNAVLYAGEVDWDAAGLEGKSRKIEQALSSGDNVLVQVTKDPVGHKGARLTTQISLPGRFLVYVPAGGATGISRKLPENERRRLKDILKRIVPEDAGVIIRTASEGISEEELERDVRRLKAQWEIIKEKAGAASSGKKSSAPTMLYEEPDLLVKVVRDLFTEDFAKLEVQGDTAWETINAYVGHVAPDLAPRLKRYVGTGDVLSEYRIDEQITKALDRKVWLPSGGYLVIDRTEAMTVIDVNTGKFTGSGGNLEETVTRNNLESAEEIVRQLRLRDIGGIIVIDFIDMVLESNRELVLRRLTECLGRDRTRHQVAEVTSLGLVQMTRKKVGTGLLEAFSTPCEHCKGRGVIVSTELSRLSNANGSNGNGGGGGGHQHGGGGSRRSRGRGKAEEPQEQRGEAGRTPERRESVVTAVQAMANAAKLASTGKPEGEETAEDGVSAALNGRHTPEEQAGPEAAQAETDELASAGSTPAETPAEAAQAPFGTGTADDAEAAQASSGKGIAGDVESTQAEAAPEAGSGPAAGAAPEAPAGAGPEAAVEAGPDVPAAEAAPEAPATAPTPVDAAPEAPADAAEAAPDTPSATSDAAPAAWDATSPAAAEASNAISTSSDAAPAASEAASAASPSAVEAPSAEPERTSTPEPAGDAQEQAEPEVEVPTPAVRTARRRPRRAASRPAGPPVHASDQS